MSGVALVIPVDGNVREIPWPDSDRDLLTTMYKEIECYAVERVRLPEFGAEMWADEDDQFKDQPKLNKLASLLATAAAGAPRPITGTVLLTAFSDGPTPIGLNPDIATRLRSMFERED